MSEAIYSREELLFKRLRWKMCGQTIKRYPTIGCCGLDCGLCPRYYTAGSSRCPGCCGVDFLKKHPGCGYITCCVKKKALEVCAECDEFPCSKFESWLVGGGEYDSFLTHVKANDNMNFMKAHGVEKFIELQGRRIRLLEVMLKGYDDGRSKSFFCIAATLLPIEALETALKRVEEEIEAKALGDVKTRSKILKELLNNFAFREGIELKLRKKRDPERILPQA